MTLSPDGCVEKIHQVWVPEQPHDDPRREEAVHQPTPSQHLPCNLEDGVDLDYGGVCGEVQVLRVRDRVQHEPGGEDVVHDDGHAAQQRRLAMWHQHIVGNVQENVHEDAPRQDRVQNVAPSGQGGDRQQHQRRDCEEVETIVCCGGCLAPCGGVLHPVPPRPPRAAALGLWPVARGPMHPGSASLGLGNA
eukprot:CAMPEP_0197896508 /NCGR_PEP_ID=MMETSP1439-20131203/40056_1 /TAXON_ID=66791 /ORGANISM="Gonyaulax spinifera, Strain CCMP409" /LENGTH=190 /DNA_ID=CAMNT_0043517047 /DNA_START=208 /DNA_END=776 /DNA_ORIENTATION=-